jgi:DNA-damage-inducible protein J
LADNTTKEIGMSKTTNVTIRLDEEVKKDAEDLFRGLGMNFSTAVNIFARQSLRQGGIPFEIKDPFYLEKNQQRLARSIANAEAGRLTIHEPIEC